MPKFKSFKEYLHPKKCMDIIKRTFMSSSYSRQEDRKRIQKHQSNDNNRKESMPSTSSAEGFIPLVAKDSEFIDLSFYNPNFNNRFEDEECEEELQIVDSSEREPMQLLFPGVSKGLFTSHTSTSEVTKLLVGQKANFGHMKKSRNLLPAEQKLTSVPEMPQEERIHSQNDTSDLSALHSLGNGTLSAAQQQSRRSISGNNADPSGGSDRNDSDTDEADLDPSTSRRRKRRRKRSDARVPSLSRQSAMNTVEQQACSYGASAAVQVMKVLSNDSLLGKEDEDEMTLSPQRQREKARRRMTMMESGGVEVTTPVTRLRNSEIRSGMSADDEDNIDD